MIRRRPSVTVVSLPSACMLSRVCALASSSSAALNRLAFICDRNSPMACSMSRCAYREPLGVRLQRHPRPGVLPPGYPVGTG